MKVTKKLIRRLANDSTSLLLALITELELHTEGISAIGSKSLYSLLNEAESYLDCYQFKKGGVIWGK